MIRNLVSFGRFAEFTEGAGMLFLYRSLRSVDYRNGRERT